MFSEYQGKPLIPSGAASDEMITYGLSLADVLHILENGYDCSIKRRRSNIIERCVDSGNKTTKVVAAEVLYYSLDIEAWYITHIGVTTRRRK